MTKERDDMTWSPDGHYASALGAHDFHERALPEEELTTDAQRERRLRILDAAVDLARIGGYDHVHMRDIADRGNVALGTVYHYFPSKVHLLVTALRRELTRFDELLSANLSDVDDPFVRLRVAVRGLIDAMEESDRVTEALTRAYVSSHVVASVEAEMIRCQTSAMFFHWMSDYSTRDVGRFRVVADIATDVWTSEVLSLVQGRRSYADMRRTLGTVISLVTR